MAEIKQKYLKTTMFVGYTQQGCKIIGAQVVRDEKVRRYERRADHAKAQKDSARMSFNSEQVVGSKTWQHNKSEASESRLEANK